MFLLNNGIIDMIITAVRKKNSYLTWYILETYPLTAVPAKTSRTRLHCFTAKFTVLRLCICRLQMGFSVSSNIWVGVGLMQIAMQCAQLGMQKQNWERL